MTTVCPPEMFTWLAASSRRFDDWLGIRLGERRLQVLTGLLPTSRPERIGRALLNVAPVPSYRLADPGFAERFAESVLHRPRSTFEDGRAALEITLAALGSANAGGPVRLADAPRSIA